VPLREIDALPAPPGLPLLGNLLQFEAHRFHQQLEQWCRELGPLFRLRAAGRRLLVVGDHALVAAILRDRPDGFRRTLRLEEIGVEMGLLPGVFGANGETWRAQRRMVMAGFDPAHIKGYFPSLRTVAQRLAGRWQLAARQASVIDLQADLMRFTVDAIAGLAFGADVNTLESDDDVIQQHLDKIFPALARRLLAPFPVWRIWRSAADRQLERSLVEVNAAVAGFIAQARARLQADPGLRAHPRNLLEAMIVAADAPGSGIDDRLVAGNVLTMLLAGEDTTANTVAWMIHLLWRNPDALALATAEVRRVMAETGADGDHSTDLTLDQLARLDYVEACAFETMRLKPVAPVLPLQALHDLTVGDVRVPAGTVVISLLRRDSVSDDFVPHADRFDPGRWLGGRAAGEHGGAARLAASVKRTAMPFGAGPRICPGRSLALLEMKMAMAVLLGRFDIIAVDTPDGGEALEHLSFTLTPVGLRMRLAERRPSSMGGLPR
jgi:cytochrome P450